jgi:hypothetical protein
MTGDEMGECLRAIGWEPATLARLGGLSAGPILGSLRATGRSAGTLAATASASLDITTLSVSEDTPADHRYRGCGKLNSGEIP